ncbi:hypothetical protein BJ138DRAFT_1111253 [Hygrophoropsis aurantiaca]|uniref:Uncharacterized protein n=1 Tax=Hygrophoropsis aurantiaca TaxID=72124 RepID=A0ACB8AKC9_9AGAM|nr:hypothetical protein BJ138DRAFT_1111253 [Hygrophoropsis aurantiaca]
MANNTQTQRIDNSIEIIELTNSEPDADGPQFEKAFAEAFKAFKSAQTELHKIRKENRNLTALRDAQHLEIERLQDLVKKLLGHRDEMDRIKLEDAANNAEIPQEEIIGAELLAAKDGQQPESNAIVAQNDREMVMPVDLDMPDIPTHDAPAHCEQKDLPPSGDGPDTGDNSANRACDEIRATVQTPDADLSANSHPPNPSTQQQITTTTKSGSIDEDVNLWKLDHLGPPVEVDGERWVGFSGSRKVISDTFGHGRQNCLHHKQDSQVMFALFNRSHHPELPRSPGEHGLLLHENYFYYLEISQNSLPAFELFVGEGPNDWRYSGTYKFERCGSTLSSKHGPLPPTLAQSCAKLIFKFKTGKDVVWVTNSVAKLYGASTDPVKYTEEGLCAALQDGRLQLGDFEFTTLKCIGYRMGNWHAHLLHYQTHPKPKASMKRKSTGGKEGTPAKRAKGRSGKKMVRYPDSEESNEDNVDEDESEDDDEPEIKRKISARVSRRA